MDTLSKIDTCSKLRAWISEAILAALQKNQAISEKDFCQELKDSLVRNPDLYPEGWYDPPPSGLAALLETHRHMPDSNSILCAKKYFGRKMSPPY